MCTLCEAPTAAPTAVTHEAYIAAIYRHVLTLPTLTPADRDALAAIKLTYGAGPDGTRGITYFSRWRDPSRETPATLVAICATGQSDLVQLCGTTLHELGHVMAGLAAGHGALWLDACARLGLGDKARGCAPISAAGTAYSWDHFEPTIREALQALPLPTDGAPISAVAMAQAGLAPTGAYGMPISPKALRIKPCSAGIGTRGGTSRGIGSGSRLLLWECGCTPKPVKIRHSGTELDATCNRCNQRFTLQEDSIPAAHTNGTGKLAPGTLTKSPAGKRAPKTPGGATASATQAAAAPAAPSGKRKRNAKPVGKQEGKKAQSLIGRPFPLPSSKRAKMAAMAAAQAPFAAPKPADPSDPDVPF